MDTPDSDREGDYSIASGLNMSLLCNEDTFVDAYVISSESDIDNEIGNEAEASCLLTCCNISKVKVKSSMARSLPVENLLPQNVGSIINYLQ